MLFFRAYRRGVALAGVIALVVTGAACARPRTEPTRANATPIEHVIVLFQENISFDHYFGTYPRAANIDGQPFTAAPNTPAVNGLSPALLPPHNPNSVQPMRLGGPSQQVTCDQDHDYPAEQLAFNNGAMDRFPEHTEGPACPPPAYNVAGLVMGYYDGNTVTALWNYAQHFALNDNFFNTTFGPSAPGHLNLISGQTHGVTKQVMPGGQQFPADEVIPNPDGQGTLIADAQPLGDDCSNRDQVQMNSANKNIGDLLNAKGVTWGWFQGGFKPTSRNPDGTAVCGATHNTGLILGGTGKTGPLPFGTKPDYVPHHEPFQYYPSTANPHHLPPTSVDKIGQTDQANHQYDLSDFWAAADAGHLPAVSFLKAPAFQDGHAGYSDPLDEQQYLVETLNHLQRLPEWKNTAVIVAYDDSDGWYDHQASRIVMASATGLDGLNGPGVCGDPKTQPITYQGRCGYGPRLPVLVISPYARANFVDHTLTDPTSIIRFIEDNWSTGRIGDDSFDSRAGALNAMFDFTSAAQPTLVLNPQTGNAQ